MFIYLKVVDHLISYESWPTHLRRWTPRILDSWRRQNLSSSRHLVHIAISRREFEINSTDEILPPANRANGEISGEKLAPYFWSIARRRIRKKNNPINSIDQFGDIKFANLRNQKYASLWQNLTRRVARFLPTQTRTCDIRLVRLIAVMIDEINFIFTAMTYKIRAGEKISNE